MNIGIVTPYYPDKQTNNSGLANHFSTLAHALAAAGNQVVIMHIRPAYDIDQEAETQHISDRITLITYKVNVPGWLRKKLKHRWAALDFLLKLKCMLVAYKNIDQVIKARALQVIETTSYFSLCYLYLKKRQTIPVVVRVSTTFLQMMDSYYPYKSRLQRAIGSLEIRMISISRFLVTHAKDHAREMEQLYNIPAQNFTIIPHGISLPALGPGNLKGGDERVKILYVGRFEYRKGTDILLAAIPAIVEKNSQVYFELIGNDPENIYENEFNRKNPPAIIAQVKFSGNADNTATAKAYAGCDIFAAPSRYESFGLIYIEAMSYGKPVIGCNVGGVTEIIEDHKNGLLIPADDAAALTAGLELLINNRQLREEMGRQARITVEDRFTKEKLAENTMAYYNQAIKLFK